MFDIRPFAPSDLSGALDVWLAANRNGHPKYTERHLALELSRVRDVYLPAAETTVALRSGRIVGFMALLGHQLAGLFVAPDCQKQGLGRMFVEHAIARTGDLELDVFADNRPARQLYDSFGFALADDYIDTATGHRVLRLTRLTSLTSLTSLTRTYA